MGIYDDIRILQHPQELEKVEGGRPEGCLPVHVRIEPTEACNFRCLFCWWHNPEKRNSLPSFSFSGKTALPRKRFLSLIRELAEAGVKACSFTGTGDPLMYPRFEEILREVTHRGLKFGLTSNMAMPIGEALVDALIQAEWLRISFNAGTPGVYAAVHRPSGRRGDRSFGRMQENVRCIDQARRRSGKTLKFNASYVVTEANREDIFAAARLARDLGLDAIAFRPDTPLERAQAPNAYSQGVIRLFQQAASELQSDGFQVSLNEIRQKDVEKSGDPDLLCFYANHSVYIDPRGDVYPCCYTRFDSRYVMGNLMDQDFGAFWNSPGRRRFYRRLIQDECPACGYGRINQVLKGLYAGESSARDLAVSVADRDDFI